MAEPDHVQARTRARADEDRAQRHAARDPLPRAGRPRLLRGLQTAAGPDHRALQVTVMRRSLSLIGALVVLACTDAGGAAASGGARVWADAGCGGCHTLAAAGASGQGGPNLDQLRPSAAAVAAQVSSGGGGMPS